MKKLCTYLTLLVLAFLGFAQPAAAVDFSAKTYYIDVSDCSNFFDKVRGDNWDSNHNDQSSAETWIHIWAPKHNKNIKAEKVSGQDNLFKFTLTQSESTIYIKRTPFDNENWVRGEYALNGTTNDNAVFIKLTGGYPGTSSWAFSNASTNILKIAGEFIASGTWGNTQVNMDPTPDSSNNEFTFTAGSGGLFMISWNNSNFWNGRLLGTNGRGFSIPSSKPSSANLKPGNADESLTLPAAGTIHFDPSEMKIWYEAAAPVAPTLSASPAGGEFETSVTVTLSASPASSEIYYTLNGDIPGKTSIKYDNNPINITETTTLKAIAFNGTAQSEIITYTYTKKQSTTPSTGLTAGDPVFIRASFIGNNGSTAQLNWLSPYYKFHFATNDELHFTIWYGQESYYPNASSNSSYFLSGTTVSTTKSSVRWGNTSTNTLYGAKGHWEGDLVFDPATMQIWFEGTFTPDQTQTSTGLYIIGDDAVGGWDTNKDWTPVPIVNDEYQWKFDKTGVLQFKLSSSGDGWNNIVAPQYKDGNKNPHMISSREYIYNDGYDGGNLGVQGPGVLHLTKNRNEIWFTATTPEPDGNIYFYGRATAWEPAMMTLVSGTTYKYGPVEGGDWKDNDFLFSDIKESGANKNYAFNEGHIFAPINNLELPSNTQKYVNVQRKSKGSDENFYIPKGKKGFVYLDTKNLQAWYEEYTAPATGDLYIKGSWNGNDWRDNSSASLMSYDKTNGVYYYHIDNAGQGFALSRSASDFWGNNNALRSLTGYKNGTEFQISGYRYVHFAEPEYNNLESGSWKGADLANYVPGTVKVRMDLSGTNKVLKVWFEPDNWADLNLYMVGAIIAQPGDTQKTEGKRDGTSQWGIVEKLIPYNTETNPGLYYYWLGVKGGDETDESRWDVKNDALFNLNKYIAEVNKDGDYENEIGHFNFSFSANGTGSVDGSNFWNDPFVPQGGGMGNLDRNGTPFPYVHREYDPGRDGSAGDWTSTNFVFKERCRVWVDAVRQLVWVELPNTKLSGETVQFTFWDKRGETYPEATYNYLRWWGTGDIKNGTDYSVELFAYGKNNQELGGTQTLLNTDVNYPWTLSVHQTNGRTDGVYHDISSAISQDLLTAIQNEYPEATKDNIKDYLWVRIKNVKNTNASVNGKAIVRPYVDNAIYTQVIGNNPAFNEYDDITEEEMKLTVTSDIRVINNATPAERMTGGFTADEAVVYPSVNQYQTVLTFNDPINFSDKTDSNLFDKTYTVTGYLGNKEFTAKDNSAEQNQIIVTGVNPLDGELDRFDKVYISLDYKSPGMMFTRSYERALQVQDDDELKDALGMELPVMNYSEADGKVDGEAIAFLGAPEYVDENGELKTEGHCALDLVLHKTFKFRDEMIQNRAAYIRYQITGMRIKKQGETQWTPYEGECMMEGKNLPSSELHVATNGRPVSWEFGDDKVNKFGELWYQEAFVNKQLDIQLSHVLCAESPEALKKLNMEFEVDVEYELIVPFADEIAAYFEAPEPGSAFQVKRRAGDGGDGESEELTAAPVDTTVPGYDNEEGYSSTLSAPEGEDYKDTHKFVYTTGEFMIPTGVENITVADTEESAVEYFNLQGMRVNADNLTPGLYIRRQGNASSKIYIR